MYFPCYTGIDPSKLLRRSAAVKPNARDSVARTSFSIRLRDDLAIELRFREWGKPGHIAREHGIKNRASIYRRAHAANLFERRHRRACSAYKTAVKRFQLGPATSDAVRIAEDPIEFAVRQHLSGPAFTNQNWVRAIYRKNRAARLVQAAARPSPGIQEPKSQHGQWASRLSLILKNRKSPNPGQIAFHIGPDRRLPPLPVLRPLSFFSVPLR